ncbi:ATP binding protein [Aureococcus anophagefferens]|nr:ATP binding protein [Aureococcus anophagefferens]
MKHRYRRACSPGVKDLVRVGADRGKPFDHVVIEMSGVADPRAVQYNLEDGGVAVDRIVTVVDAPAFAEQWMSWDSMEDRVADDGPPPDPYHGVVEARKAALASDVETASLTCAALVPDADVLVTEFGRAALADLLPNVATPAPAAEEASSRRADPDCASEADAAHDHDHDHDHAAPAPLTVDALGLEAYLERDRAAGPRFDVGAAVECNLGGPNGWTPGTVVTHNYIEEGWDAPVPYQVELGDGTLIFAPADSDEVIRASLLNVESKK